MLNIKLIVKENSEKSKTNDALRHRKGRNCLCTEVSRSKRDVIEIQYFPQCNVISYGLNKNIHHC